MTADYFESARALRVVDVFQAGNETGWVTPRGLYDRSVPIDGEIRAPRKLKTKHWFDHGTVGTNTLRFWGTGGSIANGAFSLAKYLVPRDTTVYADGTVHDTSNVVFKMIPDSAACNHTGPCIAPFTNENSVGVEYESRQNGTHDITDLMYIKGALIFTHDAVVDGIRDHLRVPHGLVATPWGRRTDPWAGLFDIARSWEIVQAIRRDARVWVLWGLPQPSRGL